MTRNSMQKMLNRLSSLFHFLSRHFLGLESMTLLLQFLLLPQIKASSRGFWEGKMPSPQWGVSWVRSHSPPTCVARSCRLEKRGLPTSRCPLHVRGFSDEVADPGVGAEVAGVIRVCV